MGDTKFVSLTSWRRSTKAGADRKCTAELREAAVQQRLDNRRSVLQVARLPEISAKTLANWAVWAKLGQPDQNASIEGFSRTFQEEALMPNLIDSIEAVREIADDWFEWYKEIRPHDVLGSLPPARYREQLLTSRTLRRPLTMDVKSADCCERRDRCIRKRQSGIREPTEKAQSRSANAFQRRNSGGEKRDGNASATCAPFNARCLDV